MKQTRLMFNAVATWLCRGVLFFLILGIGCNYGVVSLSEGPIHLMRLRQAVSAHLGNYWDQSGFCFIDLEDTDQLFINETKQFNPASIIKLPIMVEVFRQVEKGEIDFNETMTFTKAYKLSGSGRLKYRHFGSAYTIKELLKLMIIYSDNSATKMLISFLGVETINRGMKDMGLTDTVIGTANLLYAEGKNKTTPRDIALLLSKLYNQQIASPESCKEMMGILGKQHYNWGIPKYLPFNIKIAHKTGSLKSYKHDVGIVYLPEHHYIIAIFTANISSQKQAEKLIATLSHEIYKWRANKNNGSPLISQR